MNRDKQTRDGQLVVRVERAKREKFKQFCQSNGLEMSSFLYELIGRFVDGSLTLDQIKSPTASDIDSSVVAGIKKSLLADLAPLIQDEVNRAIAAMPKQSPVTENFRELGDNLDPETAAMPKQKVTQNFVEPIDNLDPETAATAETENAEIIQHELIKEDNIKIPDWLEAERQYEQQELAKLCGCDSGTMSKALSGKTATTRNEKLKFLLGLKHDGKLTQDDNKKWICLP